ncbi:tubulin-like doman-containing protein [Parabacteroides sp. OttesenSCG-928-B22]|nr:tubulin-like doman-containing protein [Parabacteroides sp. OttesenSCG-928-B22]
MATKLRRCLYVGLGGTGMNALLHTKKMFMETYGGEVPPMIGFLGIDTDEGAYKDSLNSKYGTVTLEPYQQCSIASKDARAIFTQQRDSLMWIPSENVGAIDAMDIGAGQVRTNGRLAFIINYDKLSTAINQALDKIRSAQIVHDRDYELISNKTEIHMVFSICGGTGCGTFIDMAYLIQKLAPDCKLTGYAVLPDVFESMRPSGPAMAKVKPNAYGAISDLDWLMQLNADSQPLSLNYIKTQEAVNKRPFNAIMFIDNTNENNDVYSDVDQLTEMISLSLVIAAGSLSVKAASVSDNVEKYFADKSMDVEDKRAWVAGLGACEIVFQGKDIAEIYSLKASQRLIHQMLNSCKDMDVVVNAWIDAPEVNIRENEGQDNVINYLLDKRPKIPFTTVNAPLNARPEVDQYIAKALAQDKEVQERINTLTQKVNKELKTLLVKQINLECGVSNAEEIILGIQKQVNIFMAEMQDELEGFETKKVQLEQAVQIAIDNLAELEKKSFVLGKSGKRQELIDNLVTVTMLYVETEREITRRKGALTFYRGLCMSLLDEDTRIQSIKKQLKSINTSMIDRQAEIYNQVGKSNQVFRIDLAGETAKNVKVDDNEVNIQDFINNLTYEHKLYDLSTRDMEEVKELFSKYTSKLPEYKKWSTTSIDEIIDRLPQDEFEHTMNMAIAKAMPLLQYNYQGHLPKVGLYKGYFVGVPEEGYSRLEKNDNFKKMQSESDVISFVQTGMKERIIIYRQLGVLPAFAISSLKTYKTKYEDCSTNCHIDANMSLRMQREDFSLYPKRKDDDTLELWVHGFLFGLIKFENGSYQYKSQQVGDPLFGYWVNMDIAYRDEAFERFKQNKSQIRKEFNDFIDEVERTKGASAMTEFKADVKANYLEKYAQVNMSVEELSKRGNEKIADLVRKEIVFVQKNI